MSSLRLVASALVANALVTAPVTAQEREVSQACISAYERTGELRAIFKDALRAKAEAEKCASVCPVELADECKQWVVEEKAKIARLELATPVPVAELSIRLDGERKAALEVELNAGKHELSVSATGYEPISLAFELKEGEERRIDLALRPIASPRPAPVPQPDSPIAGYTLLAVGLAGLAAGGALAIVGHVRAGDLRESCAPFCTDEQVGVVEREWIAGGVSGGVGLIALTTGVVLLLLLPSTPGVSAKAGTGGNGRGGGLVWRF